MTEATSGVDVELGEVRHVCRISTSFADAKIASIKSFSILLGVPAVLFSVLCGIGAYSVAKGFAAPVLLLGTIAAVLWLLVFLLIAGSLTSRAAGKRSELRIHEHGFALVQGKRLGGVRTDSCLWSDVAHASKKGLMGIFLGYTVETRQGTNLFLSANFEDLIAKMGPHLRHKM